MLRLPAASMKSLIVFLMTAVILATVAACGSEPTATPRIPTARPTEPRATNAPAQPTVQQPAEGHQPTPPPATTGAPSPASQGEESSYTPSRDGDELNVILATTVLNEGPQRVAFLLTTQTGLVKDTEVTITPVYVPDNAAGDTVSTRFNEWPYGTRGTFATEVEFDRPGQWRLDITAEGADATGWGVHELEVTEGSPVPAIGAVAPLSENKTLSEYGDLALVTTDYSPDAVTVRGDHPRGGGGPAAVGGGLRIAGILHHSPTCGPQVDTVSELREAIHEGQANFIHVEVYDNPDEIQGDLDPRPRSPPPSTSGVSQTSITISTSRGHSCWTPTASYERASKALPR